MKMNRFFFFSRKIIEKLTGLELKDSLPLNKTMVTRLKDKNTKGLI